MWSVRGFSAVCMDRERALTKKSQANVDMHPDSRIYVAGHRGLAGSAILRALEARGFKNLIVRTHAELDLTDAVATQAFFVQERPEFVFLAAAKVGGIHANSSFPVDFLRENLLIQTNVFHEAWRSGVQKLLFLGSTCIYPKFAPQPIPESALLTGELESTNEAYAIAKIAGIKACEAYRRQYGTNFIAVMPTNLYGPNDNFHPEHSHVLPALIRRFHEAKRDGSSEVALWGSGTPKREFLHCDDLADACLFLMEVYNDSEIVNVGWGQDCTIRELAELIAEIVGYQGELSWDSSKPDGTPQKLLDTSKLTRLGWQPSLPLREGLVRTYRWYADKY
jgi:GDP-L-fucose synthase